MSHRLKVVDNARFHSERIIEILGVYDPGTIRKHTSTRRYGPSNGEQSALKAGQAFQVFQDESSRFDKAGKFGDLQGPHGSHTPFN